VDQVERTGFALGTFIAGGAIVGALWWAFSNPFAPPDFRVVSYDLSPCNGGCPFAAVLQNRGGPGEGTVTVTVTDNVDQSTRTCTALIPSTDRNQQSKAECLLNQKKVAGSALNVKVTVTITNNPASPRGRSGTGTR
jgi:hypothetical protein